MQIKRWDTPATVRAAAGQRESGANPELPRSGMGNERALALGGKPGKRPQ
ncbi:hypothetical protein bcgnr5379_63670 [Bacillus cereus]